MQLTAGTRIGSYEITAPIGAGGMGEVYRALDPRLDREVALKILSGEHAASDDRRLRFEQEAKSASALSHPNIVTIHEIGKFGENDSRAHFIAMELVHGRSLRELLADGAIPLRKLLPIAAQIADGLAAAHAKGIAHRDLKPENIMVTTDGFVKILDFGLAKLLASHSGEEERTIAKPAAHTTPGTVMGTAAYMSPEQAAARAADFRSDQFSFGTILYEMITGRRAFQRETTAQTMSAIIESDPPPLQDVAPRTPPPLRWITERCLSKDPDERYASTRDLARDLHTLRDRLAEASTSGALAAEISATPARPIGTRTLVAASLVVVAAAAAAIGYQLGRGSNAETSIGQTKFTRLTFRGRVLSAAFTPDGTSALFTAYTGSGPTQLHLVRVGSPEPQLLGDSLGRIAGISKNSEVALIRRGVLSKMPVGGGAPRGIADKIVHASWAPDGASLAIVRETPAGRQLEYPIGTVLHRDVFIGPPKVSPDGKQLAFYQFDGGRWWAAVMQLDTRNIRRIAGVWEQVTGLAWSPDGTRLFGSVLTKTHRAVVAIDLDGTVTPVVDVGRGADLFDVAPDGRLLVAQSSDTGRMYRQNLKTGKREELTWLDLSGVSDLSADGETVLFWEGGDGGTERGGTYLYRPGEKLPVRLGEGFAQDLSSDGKWALATTQTSPEKLLLLPTGIGEPKTLQTGNVVNFEFCAFFPDSRRILISGNEAGKLHRLYVYDIAAQRITPFGADGLSLIALSPDGTQTLAESDDGRLHIVATANGASRPLELDEWVAGWTSDQRLFLVNPAASGKVIIETYDPATGARSPTGSVELPGEGSGGLERFVITPDGQYVVFTYRTGTSDLYQVELPER